MAGRSTLRVLQQEESPREVCLLWEWELLGRWRVSQEEGEEKKWEEMLRAPLVQGVVRWRQDFVPQAWEDLRGHKVEHTPLREVGKLVEGEQGLLSEEGR